MTAPERIAVFGPGLLGGSIAAAVSRRWSGAEVCLWGRRSEVLAEALRRGWCHRAVEDPAEAARGASFLVLATPVTAMEAVLAAALPGVASGVVVTDVGSVKAGVTRVLAPLCARVGASFVGSHPMAGSERAGLEHARADLFEGAACLVTPVDGDPAGAGAVGRVTAFWEALGGRVTVLDPGRHDEIVARISHLPHAVAAVAAAVALGPDASIGAFCGDGFRDTTRVAAGDPDLWTGILTENREAVAGLLRETAAALTALAGQVESRDEAGVRELLDRAKRLRQTCPPRPGKA